MTFFIIYISSVNSFSLVHMSFATTCADFVIVVIIAKCKSDSEYIYTYIYTKYCYMACLWCKLLPGILTWKTLQLFTPILLKKKIRILF